MARRSIRRAMGAAIAAPIVALGMALMIAWSAGWRLDVIETGSMAPQLPVDALAITAPVSATNVHIGDVIAFVDPTDGNRRIMHRVVSVVDRPGEAPLFHTRGDNNNANDPWLVPADHVERELRWSVPRLGKVVDVLSGTGPRVALVALPLLLLVLGELTRWRRRHRSHDAGPPGDVEAELPVAVPTAMIVAPPARLRPTSLMGAALAGAALATVVSRRQQ